MTLLVAADRAQETAANVGASSPITLLGAAGVGLQAFPARLDGQSVPYTIEHETSGQWEVGEGVYTFVTKQLLRTIVYDNSSGTTSPIAFAAGIVDVWIDMPSEKAVMLDADSNALHLPGALIVAGLITASAGATIASGQTLALAAATVSGAPTWSSPQAITLSTTVLTNVGGTGLSSFSTGDTLYYATGTALSTLAISAANSVMTSNGTRPAWVANIAYAALPTGNGSWDTGAGTTITVAQSLTVTGTLTATLTGAAAAGSLTGTTLAANVVTSSLTTIGTLIAGAVPASLVTSGTFGAGAFIFPANLSVGTSTLASTTLLIINTATSTIRQLAFQTAALDRWYFRVDNSAESGSDAGSNAQIIARHDDGTNNGNVISFSRATLSSSFGGLVTASAGLTVANGQTLTLAGVTVTGVATVSGRFAFTDATPMTFTNAQTVSFVQSSQTVGAANVTLPDMAGVSDTLIFAARTATLTNKTESSPTFSGTIAGTPTIASAWTWTSNQPITLSTAAQPNVTSVGTLSSLTTTGNITITTGGITITAGNLRLTAGTLGILTAPSSQIGLNLLGTLTGSTTQSGIASQPTIDSTGTSTGRAVYAKVSTAASAFTLTNLIGVHIDTPTVGAGSTVTNSYGLKIENQLASGFAIFTGSGQVRFQDATVITGTFTSANAFNISATLTTSSGSGRGMFVVPTIIASANSDAMLGATIAPAFTPGAFTALSATGLLIGAFSVATFTTPADPIMLSIGVLTGTGATNAYAIKLGAGPTGATTGNYLIHATNFQLTSTGTLTTALGFGCNGKAAQTAFASGGAAPAGGTGATAGAYDTAAHRDAAITLLNNIRSALVANGIMS